MFKTLRSRLLLSYILVVIVALLVVAVAIIAIGIQPGVRYVPALQRLDTISRASRNELVRLRASGADREAILQVLADTAVQNNTRILIADADTARVLYDSSPDQSWQGLTLDFAELPRRLLPSTDPNTIAGRFQSPDGSNWLLYTRAISSSGFGPQVVVYTVPEPTPFAFFRELDLGSVFIRAGAIALLLSVLLAYWISRSVARPLQKMAGAAESIAQGEYNQQLPLEGPEEVQRVAASFNSMSRQVEAAHQAQRDFVANVSHDLKTPITSIRGWSQALLDGTAVTPEDQQQAATIIHNESERMERMVAQLLDLARIESGQLVLNLALVDLGELLTAVHHSLTLRAAENQIHLTLNVAPDLPLIRGDADRLTQIFTNLADNALEHTPADGRIDITARPYGEKAVEVLVQDTGKGISPEELSRIFERFYQVDKSRVRDNGRHGSGLGLAIVRELVLLHHGVIQAKSQPGQGSLFIVRLPIDDQPEPATILQRDA
ncbi:MAG: HAMP domain-containing protein [Chloroflexi bacterium]|nr:HAMP domain-containing protein [Chloroflexota bacterium]